MKFLITGGLGFIGSSFILYILKKFPDYNVINLDDERYGSNHNNLLEIEKSNNYQFVKGDISNNVLLKKLVPKCDVVINFAAESHVDRSILEPKPFLDSNFLGVFSLLESIKIHKKKLLHVSTDEVFGSLQNNSANESYRFNPSSPYAASKASAELLINSYVVTYGCDCIITRCTNNYGPKQFPEKLIPKTIILANQNKKIPVYGTGKNIRDWIFVEDHCEAINRVMNNWDSGQSYNISTENELENITIIKKILKYMDKSLDLIEFVEDRPGHDFRYSLNSSKIRKMNWSPSITFDEGIQKTVDWYLENKNWWVDLEQNVLDSTPWK